MAKKNIKTSNQMRQETIDALELFKKNLKEYLNKGNYELVFAEQYLTCRLLMIYNTFSSFV